jgi:DNA-binding protein Fis
MTEFCYKCSTIEHELVKLRAENSQLRSVINLVRRSIQEIKIETFEEMDTLNLDKATRLLVQEALDRVEGNRTLAAKLLGIARSTLFEYIGRFEIRDKRSRPRVRKKQDWVIEGLDLSATICDRGNVSKESP